MIKSRKNRRKNKRNNKRSTVTLTKNPRYDEPKEIVTRQLNKNVTLNYNLTVPTNGDVGFLIYPAQGVASNQRVGDSIRLKEVEFNCVWTLQPGTTNDVARLIVFQTVGNQPTGIPPATTDILTTPDVYSSYILGGQTQFLVLSDTVVALTTGGNNTVVVKRLKLKPAVSNIRFIGGTVQVYSGQVWYLVVTRTNTTVITFQSTLWYTD